MTVDTPKLTKYNKRIEDLIEDAEIEAELEAENKIRSKNTKLLTISSIGFLALLGLYLQISSNSTDPPENTKTIESVQNHGYIPKIKPIPFPVKSKKSKPLSRNVTTKLIEGKNDILGTNIRPKENIINKLEPTKKKAKVETQTIEKTPLPKTVLSKTGIKKPNLGVKSAADYSWFIQMGAFTIKKNAKTFLAKLERKGLKANIISIDGPKQTFLVFVGDFHDKTSSKGMLEDLERAGFSPRLESYSKNRLSFTVGRFNNKTAAKNFRKKLNIKGFISGVQKLGTKPRTHLVAVGNYDTLNVAKKQLTRIKSLGFKGFVKRFNSQNG